MSRLPQALVEADRTLAALQTRVVTSQYLNPTNEMAAKADFEAGKAVCFTYRPAAWADDFLRALDRIVVPDHPLGTVLRESIDENRKMTLALRDRTPQAMDAWARAEGWLDAPVECDLPGFAVRKSDSVIVGARELAASLAHALREGGHRHWRVETDPVMSARVLVDSLRKVVRVNPRAHCSDVELVALAAHEIGVHVRRAANGAQQPLKIFEHGLPRCLATEEGLALYAEAEVAGLPSGFAANRKWAAELTLAAREMGFRDLAAEFKRATGAAGWLFALRVKRGLLHAEGPGAYCKDRVYWLGFAGIADYLRRGGSRADLMVGKVGLHHPIAQWRAEGWITDPTA